MRVGYVQTSPVRGDAAGNLARAQALVEGAAGAAGADLLVLPELFATGYLHESREALARLAEDADGPTLRWAANLSKRTGAAVCGGFAHADRGNIYNAAFLVDRGELVGLYAKAHLFNREKLVFDPGPGPFEVHDLGGVKVGMMICFDWQFPEAARCLALGGAQILLHPSNLVLPYAQAAMRTRCLENGVFAITANRVGGEEDLRFTGGSQVAGPRGEVLLLADAKSEGVAAVEIDPSLACDKQITERNHRFDDRRPDLYTRLTERKK